VHVFFVQERDKLFLPRCIVLELIQALKFKMTLPDENLILLVQVTVITVYTYGDSDVISSYDMYASCFPAMMWEKLCEMFVIVTSLFSKIVIYRHILKPTDSIIFQLRDKSLPLNFTRYDMLPSNIDITDYYITSPCLFTKIVK